MSTQYRLVQSGKTASGGFSAGQGSSELLRHGFIIIYLLTEHEERKEEEQIKE
jgi:hypothetical protein